MTQSGFGWRSAIQTRVRSLGKKINWKNLLSAIEDETRLIRANYFTTIRSQQANDKFYRMLSFLEFNGYTIHSKDVRDSMDGAGNIRVRGTMVGELTATMINSAYAGTDHIILFSGDGELCAAVQACKEQDARVTIVSTPDVASEDLVRLADNFISIETFPSSILADEELDMRPPEVIEIKPRRKLAS